MSLAKALNELGAVPSEDKTAILVGDQPLHDLAGRTVACETAQVPVNEPPARTLEEARARGWETLVYAARGDENAVYLGGQWEDCPEEAFFPWSADQDL